MKEIYKYIPYRVDVKKMCETQGTPYAYEHFADRIFAETLKYDKLMDNVHLKTPTFDIHLDNVGLVLCEHILTDYFEQTDIDELVKYIYHKNRYEQNNIIAKNMATLIPAYVLRQNIQRTEQVINSPSESEYRVDIAKDLLKRLHDELDRRKGESPFITLYRYIRHKKKHRNSHDDIMSLIPVDGSVTV